MATGRSTPAGAARRAHAARQTGRAARRARNGAGRGCGAWCRRRRRRMPHRCSQLLFLSGVLVVPSLAGSPLAGGWRHPNYRPGWTVFHLRSTPWAGEGRPILSGRSLYTRFRLHWSQQATGLFPAPAPPRRVVILWLCLAGLRQALPSLACTFVICMADWMHRVLLVAAQPKTPAAVRRHPHRRRALHGAAPHHITDTAGNGPDRRLPSFQVA